MVDGDRRQHRQLVIGYAQGGGRAATRPTCSSSISQRSARRCRQLPISVEARTWFNEDLESSNFIVPGVVAMVMAVIGTFLTSLTIAREWERGTMEQLDLDAGDAAGSHRRQADALFRASGMVDTALCAAIAVWWFEVPFRGTLVMLFFALGTLPDGGAVLGF